MIFDFDNINIKYKSNITISCGPNLNYIYIDFYYKNIHIELVYKDNSFIHKEISYIPEYEIFIKDFREIINNSLNLEKFSDFCNSIFKCIDSYINNLIFI